MHFIYLSTKCQLIQIIQNLRHLLTEGPCVTWQLGQWYRSISAALSSSTPTQLHEKKKLHLQTNIIYIMISYNLQKATSPAMKPVLTNITLNHEPGDIVRETAQAVNRNRCHSKVSSQICQCNKEILVLLLFGDHSSLSCLCGESASLQSGSPISLQCCQDCCIHSRVLYKKYAGSDNSSQSIVDEKCFATTTTAVTPGTRWIPWFGTCRQNKEWSFLYTNCNGNK